MSDMEKYNNHLYRMSSYLRANLAEVQAKVNDLYRVEELEDYLNVKDSPIEYIQASLAPLIGQVNDFHDYAETVTGKMELSLERVDLDSALDSVLTMADHLIDSKPGLRFEEEIEEGLPELEIDPIRFSQVLLNLIHNAVKFTDDGVITLRISREANMAIFEVNDTGIGIAEEDQEKVFEPFETILSNKDDPRLGFGIGLKLVEHIVDLHDGETWFESQAGKGSSFFFSIPLD
jgi:signal transduction histidine kinase